MMNRRINTILWMGVIGTLLIGTSFITEIYRVFRGDQNIWWTNQEMRLPIQEARNNFELYIAGEPLGKRLSSGTLFSVDKEGNHYPLVSKDITVRLNNWDNVRASILTQTTLSGFALGVSVTLLLIGLVQFFRQGKTIERDGG